MNALANITRPADQLPALVKRAADALMAATCHAEVLEAQAMAGVAYDAAKRAGRMARAKEAHDSLLSSVYRAQADALTIEARAKSRLADEYDAAQERGEVAGHGRSKVEGDNVTSAADIGLRRDQIHEARKVRDAEAADPGVFERTAFAIADRGEEPTKARVRAEIIPAKEKPAMNPKALWLWGRLKDFERDGIMSATFADLLSAMTPEMRADAVRLAPKVSAFLIHRRQS